ncbi:MAG: GNAT family N-acetyltransferase [Paracoccus denitrificans]|nr:MAG: GNAT family N-acetyltransferase [Paracoccus denitrificans]PZO84571.1 MAG: GNAT family N-acetyltransferase [Paracoccus denitrificans]
MTRIRDAIADDAAAIGAIWNPVIRDTVITFWPVERSEAEIAGLIRSRQADGHGFFVAEDAGGNVIAFASYSQFRSGIGYSKSMEHTVYVATDQRKTGIARDLMAHLEDHARNAGARLMIGAITATNDTSVRFHARLGYQDQGRIPAAGWKFGAFHDLVLMVKDLSPPSDASVLSEGHLSG